MPRPGPLLRAAMNLIYLDHSATTPVHAEVLAALGIPKILAVGTVRFSLGRGNTEEEIGRGGFHLEDAGRKEAGPGGAGKQY